MKKILAIAIVLAFAASMSFSWDPWDAGLAGKTNYKIDLGLKNWLRDGAPGINLNPIITLPVSEKVKIGLILDIANVGTDYTDVSSGTADSVKLTSYSKIADEIGLGIGVPLEMIDIGIHLGGGASYNNVTMASGSVATAASNSKESLYGYMDVVDTSGDNTLKKSTATNTYGYTGVSNSYKETIYNGKGFIKLYLAFNVKKLPINDLSIKQKFDIGFGDGGLVLPTMIGLGAMPSGSPSIFAGILNAAADGKYYFTTVKKEYTYDLVDNTNLYGDFARIVAAGNTVKNAKNDNSEFKFINFKYEGVIGSGVNLHEKLNLDIAKLTLSFEIGYNVGVTSYYTAKIFNPLRKASTTTLGIYEAVGQEELFAEKPTFISGGFNVKLALDINPNATTENNIFVKEDLAISYGYWKYQMPGDFRWASTTSGGSGYTVAADFQKENETKITNTLTVGASYKQSFAAPGTAGLPFIPYFKLGAEWRMTYVYDSYQYYTMNYNYTGTTKAQNNANNYSYAQWQNNSFTSSSAEGLVELGFNFNGFSVSMSWKPAGALWTEAIGTTSAAKNPSDTNLWNLANWSFSGACEFPPPKAK